MSQIHYHNDFQMPITLTGGTATTANITRVTFWTEDVSCKPYRCTPEKGTISITDDTHAVAIVDGHHLGLGFLKYKIEFDVPDSSYPDGYQHICQEFTTGTELVVENSETLIVSPDSITEIVDDLISRVSVLEEATISVDSVLDQESEHPVQNKVIYEAIDSLTQNVYSRDDVDEMFLSADEILEVAVVSTDGETYTCYTSYADVKAAYNQGRQVVYNVSVSTSSGEGTSGITVVNKARFVGVHSVKEGALEVALEAFSVQKEDGIIVEKHLTHNTSGVTISTTSLVTDPDYVHTDNNFTDEYKEKLEGGTETTTQTYTSDALTYGKCVYPSDLAQDNPSTLGSKWYYGFFQVQQGDVVTLTTDGNNDSVPPLLAFNGDTFVSSIAGNAYNVMDEEITYTVPAGVTQIAVNCWRDNISNFSLEISRTTTTGGLYQRVSALESGVSTLQEGMESVEALPDIVEELQQDMSRLGGQTSTDYTSDALTYGKCVYPSDLAQDNPSTAGSKWYYGFFQVQRGDVVTLTTDGNNDVIPPLLAFNGDTFVSSIAGNAYDVLDDEITYTVPSGVTQIAVNCWRDNISNFSLSISSLTGLAGRVSSLEDSTESLEDRVGALEGTTDPELKERVDVLEGNIATPSTVTRKVLVIGNSYSYDAFTYLPAVVSEAEPDLSSNWVVGICMDGSQTLEGHYTNHAVNGTTFTRYSKISSADPYGAWTTDYGATLTTALEDEDWDLIVFHQASNLACDYSSIETPLANLIAWFKAQGYTGKFGWMIVPSFPDGTVQYTKADNTVVTTNKLAAVSQTLGLDHTMTSDEMESRIMDVAHKVQRNNTDISVVLPAGVALQMARKSALNRFGECVTAEGNLPQLMYKDGHHLQMGIANLTESWAIALTLLNGMVAMADIGTPRWPHGDRMSSDGLPVGLDSESQALARQCARQALDYYWRSTEQSGGDIIIDSVPTQGSGNAVSSGGVYTALAGKANASHTHAIADVTGLQSALNAKQDALTSQTALGGVNGKTLNYGGAVVLSGEDIPLSSGSSTNVNYAISLVNNSLGHKQDTLSFGTGLSQSGNQVSVNTASAIASGETGYATGGQVFTALAGKQDTIAKGSVTITVSDWSGNAVTVTAGGVTASNVVIVSPDSASMADYAAAGVQCTAQGANTLTFSCTSTPTSSLTINYIAI